MNTTMTTIMQNSHSLLLSSYVHTSQMTSLHLFAPFVIFVHSSLPLLGQFDLCSFLSHLAFLHNEFPHKVTSNSAGLHAGGDWWVMDSCFKKAARAAPNVFLHIFSPFFSSFHTPDRDKPNTGSGLVSRRTASATSFCAEPTCFTLLLPTNQMHQCFRIEKQPQPVAHRCHISLSPLLFPLFLPHEPHAV